MRNDVVNYTCLGFITLQWLNVHFKNEISINFLFTQWKQLNIYIGFWTLEMKCTQYGICGEVAFKNARALVFLEVRQGGQKISGGSKKSRFLCGATAPARIYLPQKARRGKDIVLHIAPHYWPYLNVWFNPSPRAKSHVCLVGPCPSHASFIARSSCMHLRGYSSPLGTNVTIPGQLSELAPLACD